MKKLVQHIFPYNYIFFQNATIDVKSMMDTWTLQMGFPLVTITKQDDGKYIATQEHFLIDPGAKPSLKSPYKYVTSIHAYTFESI